MASGRWVMQAWEALGGVTQGMADSPQRLRVGTAAGSAAAGQVIDVGGPLGYAFAAACSSGGALTCLAGLTWLTV